jgi:hypothetical protein
MENLRDGSNHKRADSAIRVRWGESHRFSQLLVNVGLIGNAMRGFALDFRLDRF